MSDLTREVLFRYTAEVDPSLKKSLKEISQLTSQADAAVRRASQARAKIQGQNAREQEKATRDMQRAEIARYRSEQNNLKQQQQDALKFDRERARIKKAAERESVREIQASVREAAKREKYLEANYKRKEKEKKAAEREQSQFDRRSIIMNRQLDRSLIGILGSTMSLARGFALLGLAGEESSEKMLRGLLKVEGAFEMFRGGLNLIGGLGKFGRVIRGMGGGAAGMSGAGSAGLGLAGGALGGRFFAGSLAAKGGLAAIAALAAYAGGKVAIETGRDVSKYGLGGGYRPGTWGGYIADTEVGLLSKLAGLAPNSKLWQGLMTAGSPLFSNAMPDVFNNAREIEQTKKLQKQREKVLAGLNIRSVQAMAGMQSSGLQAQYENSLLSMRGSSMPVSQLLGIDSRYRGIAEMAYAVPQDVRRYQIAYRDYQQSQSLFNNMPEGDLRKKAAEDMAAKYQVLAETGNKAADSMRALEIAIADLGQKSRDTLFNISLMSPGKQMALTYAIQRNEAGQASRRDIQTILGAGLSIPASERDKLRERNIIASIPDKYNPSQSQAESIRQNMFQSAALNLNLDSQVKVALNFDSDQFREDLRKTLDPILEKNKQEMWGIIKDEARKAVEYQSHKTQEETNYGLR